MIWIFRWRVNVLDAVGCKWAASLWWPAIVHNGNKGVDACYKVQVDFVEFLNFFHDCVAYAWLFRDVSQVELWVEVTDEAAEWGMVNRPKRLKQARWVGIHSDNEIYTCTRSLSTIYSRMYSFNPAFVTGGIGASFLTATTKPSIVVWPLCTKHSHSDRLGLQFECHVLVFLFEILWSASLRFDTFGFADFKITTIMEPKTCQFKWTSQ